MNKCLYCLYCIVFIFGFNIQSSAQIISDFAGNGTVGYSGDGGAATLAQLDSPSCLALDLNGNIYINDQFNNCVRKVTPGGVITTVAGNGSFGFSGDGGPATNAKFSSNWGVATDASGNLYIADQLNHRIRKVNTSGIITTIAGTGILGFSGDGGPASDAKMSFPLAITVDKDGNIYFGDFNNFRVRKINTAGVISTYAGTGISGYSGDNGPATNAQLSYIFGLATDLSGNLYICDAQNHRLRKVDATGRISTVAGNGSSVYSGDGFPATAAGLIRPVGVFVTPSGVIYITDANDNRIRKIGRGGIIETMAGTGVPDYYGTGISATSARLHSPIGIVVDTNENVYFSDLMNVRVRKITNILSFVKGDDELLAVCENSGPVEINELLAVKDVYVGLTDVWTLESAAAHGTATVGYSATSSGGVITPVGLTYTPYPGYSGNDSFKVKVANALSSDIITVYVRVDPMLSAGVIEGPSQVCVGESIILTDTARGGVWVTATGRTSLTPTDTGTSCKVLGVTPGVDLIEYQITNACGTAVVSKSVTVNPLPFPGTILGPDAICIGSSVQYNAGIPGGTWSTENAKAVVGPDGLVKGVAPGVATVKYSVANTWCVAATIINVQIDTFPSPGTLNGPTSVCVGSSVSLSNSIPGGVWSSSNGMVSVNFGEVTGLIVGSDFVNYSITNSCGTAVATIPMTVKPVPEVPEINVYRGTLYTTGGYSVYQWTYNGAELPGATNDSLFAQKTGSYQVSVTTASGCSSSSDIFNYPGCDPEDILVFPNPTIDEIDISWCKKVTAKLMAADGKMVLLAKNVDVLHIGNLAAGVYLLTLHDNLGNKLKTTKILKLK